MSSCIICALVFYVKLFLTPKYLNVFALCSSPFHALHALFGLYSVHPYPHHENASTFNLQRVDYYKALVNAKECFVSSFAAGVSLMVHCWLTAWHSNETDKARRMYITGV